MARDLSMMDGESLHRGVVAKEFSVADIVESCLARIDSDEERVKSFLFIDRDGARQEAQRIDAARAAGEIALPLTGFVIAIKDNILVRGMPSTAGSRMLEGYVPPYEATAVARLRNAGAVILGKTNLDEFAMGASTEHSAFHPTNNPHDKSRVPGGSSGGSAAAVAAGFCTAALGSDTGGSVRQPAAFCGVVGMRPTYGAVSRNGLVAMASSLDTIGPIARTVGDVRRMLAVIAGHDPSDATSIPNLTVAAESKPLNLRKVTIGVPKEYLEELKDKDAAAAFDAVVAACRKSGASVIDLSLPTTHFAVPTYYVIVPAEASSNLARYDGIRFGRPADMALGHRNAYARLRGERFGSEPTRRIIVGTYTLSEGYADRYYHVAQRTRTMIREDFGEAFRHVDILLTPTTPTPAFPLGSVQEVVDMYRQDVFLAAASLAGLPAIAIPAPRAKGLPVGAQLIGSLGDDAFTLDVADAIRAAYD